MNISQKKKSVSFFQINISEIWDTRLELLQVQFWFEQKCILHQMKQAKSLVQDPENILLVETLLKWKKYNRVIKIKLWGFKYSMSFTRI